LGKTHGIRSVQASVLSGRLLIVFRPGLELKELVALIEQALSAQGETRSSSQSRSGEVVGTVLPKRTAALARQRGSADARGGIRRLLRSVSSLFAPTPVFASTAVAVGDVGPGKEMQAIRAWHGMDAQAVVAELKGSEASGLSVAGAAKRLAIYGENRLAAGERRSDLAIFIEQFISAPVALLGVSAGVAVFTGGLIDAAVILGVVLINAVIGFVTERQAEIAIASLAESGAREVAVLREGRPQEIPVEQIVPGDVLLLTPGTYVAADVRLLQSHRLSVDESALTGESLPVSKDPAFIASGDTPLGDRINMAYMGTNVTGGHARGIVIATAEATELGQIQTMVGEAEAPETPMQKQLGKMGTTLALVSGGVCAGVFGVGVLRGIAWLEMLKSSVSLAVAAVPEGLPAVATTTLAMGIANMRKRNVSMRHLDAVETLGSVQVFCMDKTGTLTMNRMTVVSAYAGQEQLEIGEQGFSGAPGSIDPLQREELAKLMQVVTLCSETEIIDAGEGELKFDGSATETALIRMAMQAGVDVLALRQERLTLHTTYRAEGRPYMTTLHPYDKGKYLLAVKGSPQQVLEMCTYQIKGGKRVRLSKEAREAALAENERMAGRGLRVLAAAYREQDEDTMPAKTEGLTWLGLAGMADPMRTGLDKLMVKYHEAGIKTIMITGDQSATASAIGQQLGLSQGKPIRVLESSKLEEMDAELLSSLVKDVHVFARVSPAHKLKIVRALQEAGYVVAMTGDGINDGPALKAADIGVAMGAGGTNVAREVSDVVLEDDNLHTMEVAISQGRTIYTNIRKMIHFMVSTNLTEIEVMLTGIALNLGEPMNPMQLLWINLVTDIFPGLALAMEPAEKDTMQRPPRDPDEAVIAGRDLKRMIFESGIIGVGTMGAYLYGMKRYGIGPAAATLAFNTLVYNELAHSISSRSPHRHVFGGEKLAPNRHLTKAVLGMSALQILVSVVPGARGLLGTTPLNIGDLLAIAAGVLGPLIVNESTKPAAPREPKLAQARITGEKAPSDPSPAPGNVSSVEASA
jgi:Ca2+-transporting ATPase